MISQNLQATNPSTTTNDPLKPSPRYLQKRNRSIPWSLRLFEVILFVFLCTITVVTIDLYSPKEPLVLSPKLTQTLNLLLSSTFLPRNSEMILLRSAKELAEIKSYTHKSALELLVLSEQGKKSIAVQVVGNSDITNPANTSFSHALNGLIKKDDQTVLLDGDVRLINQELFVRMQESALPTLLLREKPTDDWYRYSLSNMQARPLLQASEQDYISLLETIQKQGNLNFVGNEIIHEKEAYQLSFSFYDDLNIPETFRAQLNPLLLFFIDQTDQGTVQMWVDTTEYQLQKVSLEVITKPITTSELPFILGFLKPEDEQVVLGVAFSSDIDFINQHQKAVAPDGAIEEALRTESNIYELLFTTQ